MHDNIWFEIQGIPAVAIASSEFGQAAQAQRAALGMNGAHYVLVPHPIQDATDGEMRVKAADVLEQVVSALTENKPKAQP
tara:strand:- start:2619 stop:2858 length:240 start_codon:yes stop_codon:yes gene_type:complete